MKTMKRHKFRPTLEPLEERCVPTAYSLEWRGGVTGHTEEFLTPGNWWNLTLAAPSTAAPQPADTIVFDGTSTGFNCFLGHGSSTIFIAAIQGETTDSGGTGGNLIISGWLQVSGSVGGVTSPASYWKASKHIQLQTAFVGQAEAASLTFVNGANMELKSSSIDDITAGGMGFSPPNLRILNGSIFKCTSFTGGLSDIVRPNVIVGNLDSTGTDNSYFILDSSLTGNVLMDNSAQNASLTLQYHGHLYLKGGDATGSKCGITTGTGGPALPIVIDLTSNLVDFASGLTTSINGYIDNSGGVYLLPSSSGTEKLAVSGDATHDPLINEAGGAMEMGNNTTFGGQVTDKGGTLRVNVDYVDPQTTLEYKDTGSASATIGGRVNATTGNTTIDLSHIPSPPTGRAHLQGHTDRLRRPDLGEQHHVRCPVDRPRHRQRERVQQARRDRQRQHQELGWHPRRSARLGRVPAFGLRPGERHDLDVLHLRHPHGGDRLRVAARRQPRQHVHHQCRRHAVGAG
jgi:hypothetical protein